MMCSNMMNVNCFCSVLPRDWHCEDCQAVAGWEPKVANWSCWIPRVFTTHFFCLAAQPSPCKSAARLLPFPFLLPFPWAGSKVLVGSWLPLPFCFSHCSFSASHLDALCFLFAGTSLLASLRSFGVFLQCTTPCNRALWSLNCPEPQFTNASLRYLLLFLQTST